MPVTFPGLLTVNAIGAVVPQVNDDVVCVKVNEGAMAVFVITILLIENASKVELGLPPVAQIRKLLYPAVGTLKVGMV